jgi:hypothetical protein
VDGTGSGSCLLMPQHKAVVGPNVFSLRDYLELSCQLHASTILAMYRLDQLDTRLYCGLCVRRSMAISSGIVITFLLWDGGREGDASRHPSHQTLDSTGSVTHSDGNWRRYGRGSDATGCTAGGLRIIALRRKLGTLYTPDGTNRMYVRFRYGLFISVQESVFCMSTWLLSEGTSSLERPMRTAYCILSRLCRHSDRVLQDLRR